MIANVNYAIVGYNAEQGITFLKQNIYKLLAEGLEKTSKEAAKRLQLLKDQR